MQDYPKHFQELQEYMGKLGKEIPKTMGAFEQLHKNGVA
jgi:hypothetical protein